MPNRPKDFSVTATSFAADDYIMLDGATNGTRKALATMIRELALRKPTLSWFYHDATTSGSRCYARLGTAGDGLGTTGQPLTVLKRFRMPTAAATRNLWHIGSSSNGSTAGMGMQCYLHSTDKIRIEIGDVTAADRRYAGTDLGVVSRYAGMICAVGVTYDGTPTKPKIYLQGPEEATTEASTGSAPAWNAGFDDDFLVDGTMQGSSLWSGLAEPAIIINRVLSAAEILTWTQTNRLPDDCELGTGSMVPAYTSDFSAGVDGWVGGGSTRTGNVDSIGGRDDNLSFYCDGSNGQHYAVKAGIFSGAGKRFRVSFDYYIPSANTNFKKFQVYHAGPAADPETVTPAFDAWQTYTREFVETVASGNLYIFAANNAGSSVFIGANSAADDLMYVRNVRVTALGPIAKPKVTPGAIIHPGSGDNAIATVTTPGVKALGEKPDTIVLQGPAMTADGFVHLDQIITPTGYELSAAYATQVGTATSTITVKETSSGGTTVATAALSASVKQIALTVSNGLLAGNKKLHLANSAWGGNTVTPFFVFRRCA